MVEIEFRTVKKQQNRKRQKLNFDVSITPTKGQQNKMVAKEE
jgi:hypothetical protein